MLQVAVGRGQGLPPGPGEDFCLPPKSDREFPSGLGKGPHQNGASVWPGPQRVRCEPAWGGAGQRDAGLAGAGKPEQGWWMGGEELILVPNLKNGSFFSSPIFFFFMF